MKSRTTWRWNAVRGEYESGDPAPLQGTGEISAIDAFSNKTMLLLSAHRELFDLLFQPPKPGAAPPRPVVEGANKPADKPKGDGQ